MSDSEQASPAARTGSDDDLSDASNRPSRKFAATAESRRKEQQDLSGLFDEDDVAASEHGDEPQSAAGSDVEMQDATNERLSPNQSDAEEEDDDIFGGSDEDEGRQGSFNQYDRQEEDEMGEYETIDMKEIEITMPRYLSSHSRSSEVDVVRVPKFLSFDYSAFDPETYIDNVERIEGEGDEAVEQRRLIRSEVQNTVRWRYTKDKSGSPKLESNARVIKWSDGTYSLKLGSEIFHLNRSEIGDTYLAISHDNHEIVQFQTKIAHAMTIVPTSTSSMTHQLLSSAIARRQVKVRNVHDVATTEDPEKVQREAEKAEENKIRARKKLEHKRQQREQRYGYERNAGTQPGATERGAGGRGRANDDDDGMGYGNADKYEKDDFVVSDDDDDEEEERAARLQKVKQAGADKYKNRGRQAKYSDEEEEEEEEEEAEFTGDEGDDDDELEIPKRSKDLKRQRDGDSDE